MWPLSCTQGLRQPHLMVSTFCSCSPCVRQKAVGAAAAAGGGPSRGHRLPGPAAGCMPFSKAPTAAVTAAEPAAPAATAAVTAVTAVRHARVQQPDARVGEGPAWSGLPAAPCVRCYAGHLTGPASGLHHSESLSDHFCFGSHSAELWGGGSGDGAT